MEIEQNKEKFLQELPLNEVQIDDDFWNKRLQTIHKNLLSHSIIIKQVFTRNLPL